MPRGNPLLPTTAQIARRQSRWEGPQCIQKILRHPVVSEQVEGLLEVSRPVMTKLEGGRVLEGKERDCLTLHETVC